MLRTSARQLIPPLKEMPQGLQAVEKAAAAAERRRRVQEALELAEQGEQAFARGNLDASAKII